MTNAPPINNVSDTSFWVAYYRAKESERLDALFHDPFAVKLIGERGKMISDSMGEIGRYTEWSVVSRTVIIDRFIENFIKEGGDAIINLGAGLDTRPYRMSLPENLEWIEVDYPNIIVHKNKILQQDRPTCKLTRVELDLANDEKRKTFFDNVVAQAKKVLILTEGVIPYLKPEQVAELSKDLLAQKRFIYWITEYFHPRVYAKLKKSVRTQKMKNAPFQFYPDDWFGFFKKAGWIKKDISYAGEIAVEFNRKPPMPKWAEYLLPFFPKRVKDEALRTTGYVVFERA